MEPKDRIIFAADVGSLDELKSLLQAFGPRIGAVKFGMQISVLQLLTGVPIFQYVLEKTDFKVMLDLKFGDIPDTVAGAAMEVAKHGHGRILGFTVHCMSGPKALCDAVQAVKDNFGDGPDAPMVIAVTVLTSLDDSDLKKMGIQGSRREVVLRWARMAAEAGVKTIVCSAEETADVKKIANFTVINPSIRFKGSDPKSQKVVATPGDAVRNGASYIVMGSDLRKGNPAENVVRAADEIRAVEAGQ